MKEDNRYRQSASNPLPIAKNEDVEYKEEYADEEDLEAVERAHEADARQENA